MRNVHLIYPHGGSLVTLFQGAEETTWRWESDPVRPQPKSTYGSCLVQGKILPVRPQSPRTLVALRSSPVPSPSSLLTLSSYSLQPLASFLILRHAQPGMFSPPKSHDPDVFRSLLQCHSQKPSPTPSLP